jgi:hypothetical protein
MPHLKAQKEMNSTQQQKYGREKRRQTCVERRHHRRHTVRSRLNVCERDKRNKQKSDFWNKIKRTKKELKKHTVVVVVVVVVVITVRVLLRGCRGATVVFRRADIASGAGG